MCKARLNYHQYLNLNTDIYGFNRLQNNCKTPLCPSTPMDHNRDRKNNQFKVLYK